MPNIAMRFKGFVGPTYNLPNQNFDTQRLINRYLEYDEMGTGKDAEPAQLVPTPGLTPLITGLSGASRGSHTAGNGQQYWVFGTLLYLISGNDTAIGWTATSMGTINGTSEISMVDNGVQLFIVSDTGLVYFLDLSTHVLTDSSTDVSWDSTLWITSNFVNTTPYSAPAAQAAYIDGYVVFILKNSNTFFWTDLYSTSITLPSTTPGASGGFAAAEASSDKLISILSNNQDLWLVGASTTELWYNLGGATTIFARRPGILIETGGASANTIQKINNTLMWLAADTRGGAVVYMAQQYLPVRMSTFPIESVMQQLTETQINSAVASTYQINGHSFYELNIPGLTSTFVFDMTSHQQSQKAIWFEKQSSAGLIAGRSLAHSHSYFKGKHLTGDYLTGNLYFYDQGNYTENGAVIVRVRITPHVSNSLKRVRYVSLQIDFQAGTIVDPTVNPLVTLTYSDDGGQTWSNDKIQSLGKTGQFGKRIIFYKLGVSRNRVFKIVDINNCYSGISGAELVITAGHT